MIQTLINVHILTKGWKELGKEDKNIIHLKIIRKEKIKKRRKKRKNPPTTRGLVVAIWCIWVAYTVPKMWATRPDPLSLGWGHITTCSTLGCCLAASLLLSSVWSWLEKTIFLFEISNLEYSNFQLVIPIVEIGKSCWWVASSSTSNVTISIKLMGLVLHFHVTCRVCLPTCH